MANFQVTITNPVTESVDITDSNDILTIVDHSNYDDAAPEAGHNQADFDEFRKIRITLPSGTTYLFSSLYPTDGDITLPVPAGAVLPMSTAYAYNTGDGKYIIELFVLPTWGSAYSYLIATAPYVYHVDKLYKALQDSTNQNPTTETTYWAEVLTMDELSAKYYLTQNITIISDMQEVWARLTYIANCVNNKIGCRWEVLFQDEAWIDAVRLCQIQESIPVLMKVDAWDEIESNINLSKILAAKYGY